MRVWTGFDGSPAVKRGQNKPNKEAGSSFQYELPALFVRFEWFRFYLMVIAVRVWDVVPFMAPSMVVSDLTRPPGT